MEFGHSCLHEFQILEGVEAKNNSKNLGIILAKFRVLEEL